MPTAFRDNVGLQQTVKYLWTKSVSPHTQGVYHSGLKAFCRFLHMNNINWPHWQFPPISEDILIFFVAHCVQVLQLQYSTTKIYLCGIRYFCVVHTGYNPMVSVQGYPLPRLASFLNGVKKSQKINNVSRLPITYPILRKLFQQLQKGPYSLHERKLYSAVFSSAFYGFLRCGEFTLHHGVSFDATVHLCIEDIQFASKMDSVTLSLKTSKTDPMRRGVDIVLFANALPECPVNTLSTYLATRSIMTSDPQAPLFVTSDGASLTRAVFITTLKAMISAIGVNSSAYSGHSFRIGAATAAASARVEDHLIKTLGRWSSNCYQTYIRTPHSVLRQAQHAMSALQ